MKPVNLLPGDTRRRQPHAGSGKGGYAVIGVLVALLAMAVVYVLTSNKVTERENETAAVQAQADGLEAKAAQQASYTDFAAIAVTRTQSVAGVAGSRFDWERFMRELALIMPAGSWLQSTDASVSGELEGGTGDTSDTTATTSAAGAAPTPAATLVGCTPGQSDVARMMARLREAHRVTDVVLNESAQEQAGQPPTVDSCGSLYKFDLTVNFSPLGSVREAPRGERGVPASLGGGS
jgi:Tfp pilus assembly protein PilN